MRATFAKAVVGVVGLQGLCLATTPVKEHNVPSADPRRGRFGICHRQSRLPYALTAVEAESKVRWSTDSARWLPVLSANVRRTRCRQTSSCKPLLT